MLKIEKNKQYRARGSLGTLRTMMTIFTIRINERLQCIKLVLWFSITNTGVLGFLCSAFPYANNLNFYLVFLFEDQISPKSQFDTVLHI
ncbi:hypothetical protein BLOT_015789 [Blomia tropicalis]|nr:hypothetical protein BLOT_015789 [Blomia tropicalis]